jgi:thiamine transport system permease protein
MILALSTIPFVIPSILVVLGFVIFFGNNGFLNRALMALFQLEEPPLKILYSFPAIILAHTFYNFPIIMNLVSSYWEHMDENCEAASWTLGANKVPFSPLHSPGLFLQLSPLPAWCSCSASTVLPSFWYSEVALSSRRWKWKSTGRPE